MRMERREFLDLAPAYALGLLEGVERERFARALAEAEPDLKAAYEEAARTAANLSLAAPEAGLSPHVLGRLMARIRPAGAETAEPAAQPGKTAGLPGGTGGKPRIAFVLPMRVWAGIAVMLALLCTALAGYLRALKGDLGRTHLALAENSRRIAALEDSLSRKEALLDVLRSDRMQVAVMAGQDPNPAGYGKIIWDPDRKRAILHVSNLPPIPADKDYQLWVIRDSRPVDAGVFHVGAARSGGDLFRIDGMVETDRSRISAFAVTLEPKGGAPQPTGKMYLLGSI